MSDYYQNIHTSDEELLKIALDKLAQLPLENIPSPAPLPLNSRIPHNHNPFFTGRQEAFKSLARTLKAQENDNDGPQVAIITQPTAITGLGGIGKTQLAVEFAHRYGQYFHSVYWVSMADLKSINAEIAGCGEHMNLPDLGTMDLDQQVKYVQREWEKPFPRLLIFDNCEDEALLTNFRPKTGGARVLVTSRRGTWSPGMAIDTLPLDFLPRPQSIQLLQRFWNSLTNDEADAIAFALGDLPLALHLAGSYLHILQGAVTPTDFLNQLYRSGPFHKALTGIFEGHSPTTHERNVARTFELSYQKIAENESLPQRILIHLAHLSPGEPVPFNLLQTTLVDENNHPSGEDIVVARRRLVSFGLVTDEKDRAFRLHRLLHHFVRRVVEPELLSETLAIIENRIHDAVKQIYEDGIHTTTLLAWQNHLRYIVDTAILRNDLQSARLAFIMGQCTLRLFDITGARFYTEQALSIQEQLLGPEHPDIAETLDWLSKVLSNLGYETKPKLYIKRALAIKEKAYGSDDPKTADSIDILATILIDQGDYAEAQSYIERALAIKENTLDPEHPDRAYTLELLGKLLVKKRDYAQALSIYKQVLTVFEKVLDPNHLRIVPILLSLYMLERRNGNDDKANSYYDRALNILTRNLGSDHPATKLLRLNQQILDTPLDTPLGPQLIEHQEEIILSAQNFIGKKNFAKANVQMLTDKDFVSFSEQLFKSIDESYFQMMANLSQEQLSQIMILYSLFMKNEQLREFVYDVPMSVYEELTPENLDETMSKISELNEMLPESPKLPSGSIDEELIWSFLLAKAAEEE